MIPEKIGRYEIVAELGQGGMATVFRGRDPRFGREVAIKVLPPQYMDVEQFRARFEREARTIAALEHPAIVPVYDFGEEAGQPYLVMRLMTGGSLADKLKSGPLRPDQIARILERISSALDEAHKRGIVHRDLKPGNILFDQYGAAYLSDFGIVRLTESDSTLTGQHTIGTPGYMSPEQIQGEPIDGRTDIYALGIMVFQMLTGELPYSATTPAMVMVKHLTEPVPDVRRLNPELPPAMSEVLSQTMAKDRNNRPATAGEVARLLAVASAATGEAARLIAEAGLPPTEVSPTRPAVPEVRPPAQPAEAAATEVADAPPAPPRTPATPQAPAAKPYDEAPEATEVMRPDFAPQRPEAVTPGTPRRLPRWLLPVGGLAVVGIIVIAIILAVVLGSQDDEEAVVEATVAATATTQPDATEPPRATTAPTPEEERAVPGPAVDADRINALLEEAWTALNEGRGAEALALTRELTELDPGNAEAWQIRGFAFRDLLDQPEGAIGAFSRAIELEPDTWWFYADRAWTYDAVGNHLAALDDAKQCVAVAPDEPDCQLTLGVFAGRLGRYDLGLEAFDAAERLAPEYAAIFLERGFMLDAMGELEEALANYRRAVELNPDDSYYRFYVALELNRLGRYEEALPVAQECVDRFPEVGDCYIQLGEALRGLGDPAAAAEVLNAAVDQVSDPETRYWLLMEIGYSYRDDGDFDAARETFERAAAILPDEASDAYIEVAWSILDDEGDLDEARAFAERAVETNPENPYAWDVLAAAWEALEDIPQAATAYARLLELMPPDECPDCIAAAREVLAEAQRSSAETVRSTRIATVSVPGSWNDVVGCDGTWLPECPAIRLEPVGEGVWAGTFALPVGEWEVKVAINGTWEINFGRLGLQDGLNIPFVLERDAEVTFTFRAANRLLEIDIAR